MPDLCIAVDRHEIVVSKPGSEFSVTYRRQGRVLVADNPLRTDPSAEELSSTCAHGKLSSPRRSRSAGFTDEGALTRNKQEKEARRGGLSNLRQY
jgi:hypothetical protein